MASRRGQRGQATTDYVALLGLLAVLLALALGVVTGGAPGIVNAVRGQIASALCVVVGSSCPVDAPPPCAVAVERDRRGEGLTLGFIKLSKDHTIMRERLSDGTIRLTDFKRYGAGAQGGLGVRAQIDEDLTSDGGLDREARFGAQAVAGLGNVYYARDTREADRIVQALKDGRRPAAPLRAFYLDGGARGTASLKAGVAQVGLSADASSTRTLSLRRDVRTGATTIALNIGDSGSALAAAVAGGPAGSLEGYTTLAVTLDRHRHPIELSLLAQGTVNAGGKLSRALATLLALRSDDRVPANLGGRRWEFEAHVKLTDPEVAAAWRRFRGAPTSVAAIRALGHALYERAALDVRTYKARTSANGTALGIGLGLRIGGETDHVIDRFNLLSARRRPPGGLWEARFDCV